MATLRSLRIELGWSVTKLAEESGVAFQTISRAEKGKAIAPRVAKALADALSKGYDRDIKVLEIEGLQIQ